MKARSIARELALLGASQISDNVSGGKSSSGETSRSMRAPRRGEPGQISSIKVGIAQKAVEAPTPENLDALLKKALTTLSADAQATIETAEGELTRGSRLVLESETRTIEPGEVRDRIQPAIPLVEAAINRVGETLELLMFVQQEERKGMMSARQALKEAAASLEAADQLMAEHEQKIVDVGRVRSQLTTATDIVTTALIGIKAALVPQYLSNLIGHEDIRTYACDLLYQWIRHWQDIDSQLDDAMEKWNVRRLARVDRDILRLAMIEIIYLDVPKKVAIDEAIELAKRYSDEDGYRFINGVLRRTTDKLEQA